ncbi:MAG TPA: AraC family transcriptional regulator [Niallia sp.]|nr:AraC family transcriptional regulator [Niallia sp.]
MELKNTYEEPVNEEVIYQNPLLSLKVWEIKDDHAEVSTPVDQYPWHYHKEVELLAILEGTLTVQTKYNYVSISPGDVLIMGASQPHRTSKVWKGKLRYVVLQVDLAKHFDQSILPYLYYFSELTNPLEFLNYIFTQNEEAKKEAHQIITEIHRESQEKQKGYEIAINYAIKKLILLLVRNDTKNMLHYSEAHDLSRMKPVLDYIDTHLSERILVEDACDLLNFSYHYFIKYFKKTMGMSFIDYINMKRIKKAELLLLTTDKSILEISYEVGISNLAQFYKLFKRQNQCSPKVFKNRMVNGRME